MLHLAQVQKSDLTGEVSLKLLASQHSEYSWTFVNENELIIPDPGLLGYLSPGVLVLVELTDTYHIAHVQDAKDWLLGILQTFLSSGITPEFLQQETERAEKGRQELTLRGQELDRRVMELEARREQLQQLEETLKREKKQLEQMAAQYKLRLDSSG